jgi:glucan phosphoethanolaminetransferase (alkaline phosphatase superfamily)
MGPVDPSAASPKSPQRRGPSAKSVRKMLVATMTVLGIAALVQAVAYALLIVNRTTLLHPVVAGAAVWLGILASLAAIVVVVGCAVLLTRWLIARRAASFASRRLPESRPGRALWAGCLVPLVNLVWAPVYVIELAAREGQFDRLRKPIVVWWLLWVLSTAAAVFATATSWAQDAQGIANNTVAMVVAYLLGLAAAAAAARVFEGFERRPVQRPAHRWVVVADDRHDAPKTATPAGVLEPDGREPAA